MKETERKARAGGGVQHSSVEFSEEPCFLGALPSCLLLPPWRAKPDLEAAGTRSHVGAQEVGAEGRRAGPGAPSHS